MSGESKPTIDRRRFLTVLGATGGGALALSGCSTDRVERLIPYLVQSEDQVPGVATWYASSCTECPTGCGVHVRTREGRAVKLEGNPQHPINQGKLCSRGQAALQGLYNPGRLTGPMARGADGRWQEITWDEAIARLSAKLSSAGGRVAAISGAGRGTFSDLLGEWIGALGGRVVRYQPFASEPVRAANRQVFGTDQLATYDFAKAKYIVSFGGDFLDTGLGSIEHQRGFAESHGFAHGDVAKFVYVAPRMNLTGLNADEWQSVRPGTEAALALAMANVLLAARAVPGLPADLGEFTPQMGERETGIPAATIQRLAREFAAARPSLAVAGGIGSQHRGATELCAAVNILNLAAGNIGETVRFGADPDTGDGYPALANLMASVDGGGVAVLLLHDVNPAYTLPRTSGFVDKIRKVGFKVSTSMYLDETAALCDLLLPQHHALERWDDLRPREGVYSLMQPVMEPVFNTLPAGDVLLRTAKKVGGPLARFTAPTFQAHLQSRWQALATELRQADFTSFWQAALQRGGYFADNRPASKVSPAAAAKLQYTKPQFEGDGDFVFTPYPHALLYDGRGANKPWLLENADPVTKITWHNWVEVSPQTARRLRIEDGDILRVTSPHGTLEAPAYVYLGIRDDTVAMPLGFGHTEYGTFAQGRGVNALDLLGAPQGDFFPYVSTRVSVSRTSGHRKLASIAGVPRQLGRGIAEGVSLEAAKKGLTVEQAYMAEGHGSHEVNTEREVEAVKGWSEEQKQSTKHGDYAADHPRWGMAIDLAKCTGCQACVTACYAENNIPTVGEGEIRKGREMTWMRIERYWEGGEALNEPVTARFVPMLCQHCSNAPCEPVCPVYAAYHTPDGLNGQVYNRCVGTRYCANNCPYKVRYFNWYKYNESSWPSPLHLQLNPDVTVRARGVMEKCTFCIQRIRGAQNDARVENRQLSDGEFTTACAQACPSNAIVFGNAADPGSQV
ncbi:MAG TPA: molybdopterin-dependent oxidoreductase, partial [Gemmatimonadales bacterium]|nr:molybdopterin-dependent oxidoreductase [Gemmatimonadales bacterium]